MTTAGSQAMLTIANAAGVDPLAYRMEIMPALKVGLFSDGASLAPLVTPLEKMGFAVTYHTNNYEFVQVYDPVANYYVLTPVVRYMWDDAQVMKFDVVIADLSGPRGYGRMPTAEEQATLDRFVAHGGTLLVTGVNPLTQPDNAELAQLCGLSVANRDTARSAMAVAAQAFPPLANPLPPYFVSVAAGEQLAVSNQVYDLAPATNASVFFTAGVGNKLTRRIFPETPGQRSGMVCLWTGNPADNDWALEGVWQDVLRELLRARCYEDAALQTKLSWLHLTGLSTGVVSAAGNRTFTFTFNDSRLLEPDLYKGVAVLVGNHPGEETLAVPITLDVGPSTLRVYTTGKVTDWRGVPLRGDGSVTSCLYQVIYAGPDGQVNPPNTADGAPTGDDELLATFMDNLAFGRFGDGAQMTPNSGKFDKLFAHTFFTGTTSRVIYVRAWDGESFPDSLVWGDSTLKHTLTYEVGEKANFGSWSVTNIIDVLRDSNGDGVPDSWIMKYRKDLDPRAAVTALVSVATSTRTMAVPKDSIVNPSPRPYKVVVSKANPNVIFALDQANNRIVTLHTNNAFSAKYFRPKSGIYDVWGAPEGLAADPRPNQYRVAVSDTDHHRVMLYTYNTNTWAFTFERQLSLGYGTGNNKLNRPAGVAFDGTGRLYVADKLNNRIAIFEVATGNWVGAILGNNGSYNFLKPEGVCVDPDLDGGIWVADTGNSRVARYLAGGSYAFQQGFGVNGSGDGQFQTPMDVQVWRMGTNGVKRLVVVDKANGRLQIFRGASHLLNVGSIGTLTGQLSLPSGVWPIDQQPTLVVADTQNSRIQWFNVRLDIDQDGMDDFWEDIENLDSTVDDADEDPDGDTVTNGGEAIANSDPLNPDTNGNGGSDGWEVANGYQPNVPSDPVNPPHLLTLTASPGPHYLGSNVVFQATFDQPIADTPVWLQLSSGVNTSLLMQRDSPTAYSGSYTVQAGDNGWVDAALSGVWSTNVPAVTSDPVVYTTNNFFLVLTLIAQVQNVTVAPAAGATGTNITIDVTFDHDVVNGTPQVALAGAANFGPVAMANINNQHYRYVYAIIGGDGTGQVDVTIQSALTAGSGLPVPTYTYTNAFAIYFNPFAITQYYNPGTGLQIQWQSEVGAKYQVLTNANLLLPAGWGVLTNVTATSTSETYTPVIDPLQPALFYRIRRINP